MALDQPPGQPGSPTGPPFPTEPAPTSVSAPPDLSPPELHAMLHGPSFRKRVFLKAFAETAIIGDGCTAARVTRATVYRWCEKDPKFRERFLAAQEDGADRVERELYNRAMIGVERKIVDRATGRVVDTFWEKSDQLLIILLKGMRPLKYKDRVDSDAREKLTQIQDELHRLGIIKAESQKVIEGEAKVIMVEDAMLALPDPGAIPNADGTIPTTGAISDPVVKCTWEGCSGSGSEPLQDGAGVWVILCDTHAAELAADPQRRNWVLAQGGAALVADRASAERGGV